jgi:hypothetical protein
MDNHVMNVFRNPDKLKDFLFRVEAAGHDSQLYKNLKSIVLSSGVNNTSPLVTQTTILQHAFKFSDLIQCFGTFRLVCRDWKSAVETARYSNIPVDNWNVRDICKILEKYTNEPRWVHDDDYDMYSRIVQKPSKNFPLVIQKALQSLKTIEMFIPCSWSEGRKLILENVQNLTYIKAKESGKTRYGEEHEQFVRDLIQTSNNTLKGIYLPSFNLPDVSIPKLETFKFNRLEHDFETKFKTLVKNAPNLETIEVLAKANLFNTILSKFEESYPQHFHFNKYPSLPQIRFI